MPPDVQDTKQPLAGETEQSPMGAIHETTAAETDVLSSLAKAPEKSVAPSQSLAAEC